MKSNIVTALAVALVFMCSAVAMNAQDNTSSRDHLSRGNAAASGCLQKGSNGNDYTLTAQDGSTWTLTSNAMNLDTYVGKQVTVAGTDRQSAGHHLKRVSQEANSSASQHGPMDVLDLVVDHESCQQ